MGERLVGPDRTRPARLRSLGIQVGGKVLEFAIAANLKHPHCVQVVCGTPDQLPRTFVELDRKAPIRPPRLQRTNGNAEPPRRDWDWVNDAQQEEQPRNPSKPPQNSSPPTARYLNRDAVSNWYLKPDYKPGDVLDLIAS